MVQYQITQLTNNNLFDTVPQISGNNIVWTGNVDTTGDLNNAEIYFYNGSETIRLTNNNFTDLATSISGNNAVWFGNDGNDNEIYNDIVNQFGNSAEADRLFGSIDNNRDRVNRVYQFVFDRDGDAAVLEYWTEQIDLGNVTLATFALEIALGAQKNDIVVLNHKIESANLFSNSINTQQEREAYSGFSGESFGREWLDSFRDTTSTQAQVDSALTDLVNDSF